MTFNFKDIIGQKEVIKYLLWSLKEGAMPKSLIFFGEPGIGKTTLARSLAKSLLCSNQTGEFCGNCSSCKTFENNDHLDYCELDSAVHSSVDSMREIVEIASYKPQISPKRVFVLDECHRLSSASFSVILKTLEETGAENYFILVTTNLEKMPENIISRSVRLKLLPPPIQELKEYISKCDTLGILDKDVEDLISVARLRPRDLNHLISMCKAVPDLKTIKYLLGIPQKSYLISYWIAIDAGKFETASLLLEKINLVTGSCLGTLNFLIAELRCLHWSDLTIKASKVLIALIRQHWLDPSNLAFLFTAILTAKNDRILYHLLYLLARDDKSLYWRIVHALNRIVVDKGIFRVIGNEKLTKELQNYYKNLKDHEKKLSS